MAGYARGKHSKAVSDRSGAAFPYKDMIKEWNGSLVHKTEYENKHPQLEPRPVPADAVALRDARPQAQSVVFASIGRGADTSFSSSGMTPKTIAEDLILNFTLGEVIVS